MGERSVMMPIIVRIGTERHRQVDCAPLRVLGLLYSLIDRCSWRFEITTLDAG